MHIRKVHTQCMHIRKAHTQYTGTTVNAAPSVNAAPARPGTVNAARSVNAAPARPGTVNAAPCVNAAPGHRQRSTLR